MSLRNPNNHTTEIRLVAVAGLAKWHGYDRLLEGLGEYYRTDVERKVIFHIVGEGPVREEYEQTEHGNGRENYKRGATKMVLYSLTARSKYMLTNVSLSDRGMPLWSAY